MANKYLKRCLGTHTVEGENQLPELPFDLHACTVDRNANPPTKKINKYNFLKKYLASLANHQRNVN